MSIKRPKLLLVFTVIICNRKYAWDEMRCLFYGAPAPVLPKAARERSTGSTNWEPFSRRARLQMRYTDGGVWMMMMMMSDLNDEWEKRGEQSWIRKYSAEYQRLGSRSSQFYFFLINWANVVCYMFLDESNVVTEVGRQLKTLIELIVLYHRKIHVCFIMIIIIYETRSFFYSAFGLLLSMCPY